MIKLSNVNKKFQTLWAVSDVSFEIGKGEIVGLLGPNGAGKTTTMRLMTGVLIPTSGEIKIAGLNPISDKVSVNRLIGYLPENNPLYLEMLVEEYLHFIAEIKEDTISLDLIKKEIGIEPVLTKKIESLSRGFRQRVGLAAALLGNPKILILDEPTSGLDPVEQEKIRQLIKQIGKEKTVIISTHILSEAEEVATRLLIINEGKIVYDGEKPKIKGGVEKLFMKLIS